MTQNILDWKLYLSEMSSIMYRYTYMSKKDLTTKITIESSSYGSRNADDDDNNKKDSLDSSISIHILYLFNLCVWTESSDGGLNINFQLISRFVA